jgi:phage-related minor tail protein
MLSVTILPLAAMAGGKAEDIDKAKQELSQMEGKVPGELKPAFEKLRAFTESAGSDFSKYGDGQFEELMKPIQDWTEKNCK